MIARFRGSQAVLCAAVVALGCGGGSGPARVRDAGRRDGTGAGGVGGVGGVGSAGGGGGSSADGANPVGSDARLDQTGPPSDGGAMSDGAAGDRPGQDVPPGADTRDVPVAPMDAADARPADVAQPVPDTRPPVDMAPPPPPPPDVAPPPVDLAPPPPDLPPPDTAPPAVRPVLLNQNDKSSDVELSPNRLAMDQFTLGNQGVRSDTAVTPGSGMFYFEASRHVTAKYISMGVATRAVDLEADLGSSPAIFGADSGGGVGYGGNVVGFSPTTSTYGFIVDYRSNHPIVHTIGLDGSEQPAIVFTADMASVREPLYIYLGGLRRLVGFQASINPGNDVVNFPFVYDPVALMNRAGIAGANQLVRGWGRTHAGPFNNPPTLSVSADQSVAFGSPVTVTATATDAEDGAVTGRIKWEDLATPFRPRLTGTGGTFTFTPDALGLHPLQASITDQGGKVTTAVVKVNVTGTLPAFSPVRLVADAQSGTGVELTPNGLGAHFTVPLKMGVRANQGLLKGFQYFEIHRELPPINMGGGVVIRRGNLNPYDPPDVPPSCSINTLGGTWHSLMYSDGSFTDTLAAAESYYGFAVDYRGSFPTVYIIVGNRIVDTIPLPEVTVPLYPMLYGNLTGNPSGPDETINFGATAFRYDARAILSAAGVDVNGFTARWGM